MFGYLFSSVLELVNYSVVIFYTNQLWYLFMKFNKHILDTNNTEKEIFSLIFINKNSFRSYTMDKITDKKKL